MNANNDKKRASALTGLLCAELRDARFSVTHVEHANTKFVPGDYSGHPSSTFESTLEETSKEELDAHGLKSLHQEDSWKRQSFRSDIRVKALCRSSEGITRRKDFERLLDTFGVLSEGHVAHGLGSVLPTRHRSTVLQSDLMEKSVGVSATADLWSYLVVDSCLTTPRRTASKVLRWVRGAPLGFESRVLLGRLCADSPFALANGLAVERLPRKSDHLEGWFPTRFGVALSDYLDRTILRIPCKIAPVLSKPTKVTEQHGGTPVESWQYSADFEVTSPLSISGIYELRRALSLICDVAVETPMIWTDYRDHAHFGQHLSSSNYGSNEPTPRTATVSMLTADNLRKAIRLQPELRNLPPSVETAFQYWLKSKSRRPDSADRLVFLRTALEALFLDGGNRAELTFRLATNGAWYTGRNPAERRQRYNTLKNVYAAASGAVHSGRVKKNAERLLTVGQEICRLAILKRLRSNQAPVWEDIVFGR